MTDYVVTGASAGREFDMLSAAFTDGTSHVLLSRSIDPDDDDRSLGIAGLHLEYGDQIMSGYDLISGIAWEGSTLRISLNVAAQAIGLPAALNLRAAGDHLDEDGRAVIDDLTKDETPPTSAA